MIKILLNCFICDNLCDFSTPIQSAPELLSKKNNQNKITLKKLALLHFRTPLFFIDDSGAEFHAD